MSEKPRPPRAGVSELRRGHLPVERTLRDARSRAPGDRPGAPVTCCHGGAQSSPFGHQLHLGGQPLTVRQSLHDNLGPPLALLPARHAGRSRRWWR